MFENIDVYPYRRIVKDGTDKKQRSGRRPGLHWKGIWRGKIQFKIFSWTGLSLVLAAFFLGRAVILGELVPFATAFVAGVGLVFPSYLPVTMLGVMAGLATVHEGIALAGSVSAVVMAGFMVKLLPPEIKRPWLVAPGLLFAVTLIVRSAFLTAESPSMYDFISALFEAVMAAVITAAFLYALPTFKRIKELKPLSPEEFFCVLVLLAGIVAGVGDLGIGLVTLEGVLCRVVILVFALMGGAGMGAAAGAMVGIIPGLSHLQSPAIVGAYSFAGLLAGVCRGFGKPGVAVGFVLGNIILSAFVNNYANIDQVLAETGVAVLIFLLAPHAQLRRLTSSLTPAVPASQTKPRESRVGEVVTGKVRGWSRIFQELSSTYSQVSAAQQEGLSGTNLQVLLDDIGNKVCRHCAMYRTCWERDFYKTYQNFLDLFSLVEVYGQISGDDLNDDLKRRCSRPKELAIMISCLYETYKLNQYWARRLSESREVVSEQLKGVSEIMDNLTAELEQEIDTAGEADNALKQKLKQEEIPVSEVRWLRQEDGPGEVIIARQSCRGDLDCQKRVAPLISKIMGHRYTLARTSCVKGGGWGMCNIRFYPRLRYRLSLGLSMAGKSGDSVSGDSYAVIELKGGKVALILSDGMGSGPPAARESNATVALLRSLLDAGFGKDLAIKTVNSIMMLRSPEDSFATVDMAVVDLYNGSAEFIKIAAPPSFVLRKGRISIVRANSLPVGIIKDIEVSTVTKSLSPGDVLVMLTDGVQDAHRGGGKREEWIDGVLEEVGDFAPQELADLLLKLAQAGAAGGTEINDDMTVLVARLDEI